MTSSALEACRTAHDNRWLGAEPDRPGVPAGNEHWIRVSTAVARLPQWFPAHLVPMYAFGLPLAIAGQLPSNRDASELKRWLSAGGDVELLRRCRAHPEAYALIMAGRS